MRVIYSDLPVFNLIYLKKTAVRMVSIYNLKFHFQIILRPLVQKLATYGITANQVTMTAVCLSKCVTIFSNFEGEVEFFVHCVIRLS